MGRRRAARRYAISEPCRLSSARARESLPANDYSRAAFECSSDMRAIVGSALPVHSNR